MNDNVTLKGARRMLTMNGGSFRITRRNGKLYTIRIAKSKQPNTEKQLECRELLKRANEMAREDLVKAGRKKYWEDMARKKGYKTAIGCARAWYIAWMKGEVDIKEKREDKPGMMKETTKDIETLYTKNRIVYIGKTWKKRRQSKERRRAVKTLNLDANHTDIVDLSTGTLPFLEEELNFGALVFSRHYRYTFKNLLES